MAQRNRRGGMTAAQLLAGGVEQTAFLRHGKPVLIELYPGAGANPWRVSFTRHTTGGNQMRDVTEHATLRAARREFRRLIRTYKP